MAGYCRHCKTTANQWIHYPCHCPSICNRCFGKKSMDNKYYCNICQTQFSYIEVLLETFKEILLFQKTYRCYMILNKNSTEQDETNKIIKKFLIDNGAKITSRVTNPWEINAEWENSCPITIFCINESADICSVASQVIIPTENVSEAFISKKYEDCLQRQSGESDLCVLKIANS